MIQSSYTFKERYAYTMRSRMASRAESKVVSDASWDAFVARHPDGYHEQTSMYGRLREDYGFTVDRVTVQDAGEIVAGAQVLVQNTPIGKYASVLRSPMALGHSNDYLQRLVEKIDQLARDRAYAVVRVDTFPTQSTTRAVLQDNGFTPSRAWGGRGTR